jgi:hypothetical protein
MSPPTPPAVPITREEADRALAGLGSAYDRIAVAMFALDSHPGLGYLRGGALAGTTRQVSQDVQELMTLLWARFSALRQQLELARDTRAARSRPGDEELATLTRVLREPVVALADDGFPLDGAGTPARRLTLDELARGLEAACAGLADQLAEVDAAVSAVAGRLAALTDALGGAQAQSAALRTGEVGLDRLTADLDRVREQVLTDPIEVARGGAHGAAVEDRLGRLAADLDAAGARLAELTKVRDEHPQRLARLRAAVDELAAAEVGAGRSCAVVRVKIVDPGLPDLPGAAARLRERLSGLEQLGREGRWVRLADELTDVEQAASDARSYADRLREAADGLLDRRTELRGRLAAYRAKAARLGFAEHLELSDRHRKAQDLLYTSPCDLPAATRAVLGYQQSLAEVAEAPSGKPAGPSGEPAGPSGEPAGPSGEPAGPPPDRKETLA